MFKYFSALKKGKIALWCYLIWYLVTLFFYFDPSPAIWLNSLGISVVIGVALLLSVSNQSTHAVDRWQVFRLFLMPFCVSSFSSLIKDHGFILIVPPRAIEQITAIGLCLAFIGTISLLKLLNQKA